MFIIDDLLSLPAKGFMYIVEKIHDMAKKELEDTPEKLKRELLELQMRFGTDEISDEEYRRREDEILIKLENLQKE